MNCAIHADAQASAYCRTCGKALCENCKREVAGVIYCEPCLAARLQGAPPPASTSMPAAPVSGAPNPTLAGLLGFIPGVGAMYNGQFVKAFVHVVIFACLIVLTSHIGLVGLLIGFFVIYMIFEAHQTAKAKSQGLPNPDFLGLDRMFGVEEHEPAVRMATAPQTPSSLPQQSAPARERAPIGAVVLVALGVFFLVQNFHPDIFDKFWPILLIGFGFWIAYKRTAGRR